MNRRHDPKVEALSTVEVFADLPRRRLQAACRLMTEVHVPAGKILCEQGAPAQEVFLLIDGDVAVTRDSVALSVVGSGGIIGEMALTDGGTRTATTTALTDVTAMALSSSEFHQLLATFPGVAAQLHTLSERRRSELEAFAAA